MSRKSTRELERVVEALDVGDDQGVSEMILYEDPETGEFRTSEGNVVALGEADPIAIFPEEARRRESRSGNSSERWRTWMGTATRSRRGVTYKSWSWTPRRASTGRRTVSGSPPTRRTRSR